MVHSTNIERHIWRPLLMCLAVTGCSFKQTTVDVIGDAITGGSSVYASDEDPQLVKEALPFGLKTFESLLQVSPEHRGLLLASSRGFAAYAFLLQWEADQLQASDLAGARKMRARARNMFLRGRDFAFRGLELDHPDFRTGILTTPDETLAAVESDNTAFLYWGGATWAGALSAAKDDLTLIAELPLAGAMVGRVLELDDGFDNGAAHEFFISYEAGRPGGSGEAARAHYDKALEYSKGTRASAHVALAESVAVRQQKLREFRQLLSAAAAVDTEQAPQYRLVNNVAIERAQWLTQRIPELFVHGEEEAGLK